MIDEDWEKTSIEIFNQSKASMISGLLRYANAQDSDSFTKNIASGETDCEDAVHTAADGLDLSHPSVLEGAAAAILETLMGDEINPLDTDSVISAMTGQLAWSVFCFATDAAVQLVEDNCGKEIADKIAAELENSCLRWYKKSFEHNVATATRSG